MNTLFLTDTHTTVGYSYTLVTGGHRVTVRIVGEVFAPGNDLDMYLSPSTLAAIDPSVAGAGHYDVALKPGAERRSPTPARCARRSAAATSSRRTAAATSRCSPW